MEKLLGGFADSILFCYPHEGGDPGEVSLGTILKTNVFQGVAVMLTDISIVAMIV